MTLSSDITGPATGPLPALPATFAASVDAVHAIGEHVLCAVRHAAVGRVGLRPTVDGVATPPYGESLRSVGVEGDELVDRSEGDGHAGDRRARITTVRDAAEFFGVAPGIPGALWTPVTEPDLDAPINVDPAAIAVLAQWYAFIDAALGALHEHAGRHATLLDPLTLWPEGFDLATTGASVNYGGSPGDQFVTTPYLYVGPVDRPFPPTPAGDPFWNEPFGASLRYDDITSFDQAVAFFTRGFDLTAAARAASAASAPDAPDKAGGRA